MPLSLINPTNGSGPFEYSEDSFVISHLNRGPYLPGHSALLVEGMQMSADTGQLVPFIGCYDIMAIALEAETSPLQSTRGIVTDVRCFEGGEATVDYSTATGRSYIATRQMAKLMIESIKKDRGKLYDIFRKYFNSKGMDFDEMKDSSDHHYLRGREGTKIKIDVIGKEGIMEIFSNEELRYQKRGKFAFFTSENEGDNCTGWCNRKLAEIGLANAQEYPKPKVGAGNSCAIL